MARGRREIPPCCKTYGLPLYCASCVPIDRIPATAADDETNQDQDGGDKQEEIPKPSPSPSSSSDRLVLALGGGGGEGRSGVPNALILSVFDFGSRSLSDHPICRLGTGGEAPYRMAVHPAGHGVICSFLKSCRWFEWDFPKSKELDKLALKSSEKILTQLEGVGEQLALVFNAEGSIFAAGGEDGYLRVFKWPSMEILLDQADAHTTVKDMDFSSDAKYLVSSGSSGPCRVWDLTSSTSVASLQREAGEIFGFCRFSQCDENQTLYVTAMHGDQGKILSWNVSSWKRVGSKKISRDPISAFSVSSNGKFFAVGTVEGNILIVNSNLQPLTAVKKAHLGPVTALVFSQDSRALVSTSFDSTARVTLTEGEKKIGFNLWLVIFIILLAYLIYFLKFQRNSSVSTTTIDEM